MGTAKPIEMHHADGSVTTVQPDVVKQAAIDSTKTGREVKYQLDVLRTLAQSYEGRYTGVAAAAFKELMDEFDRQSNLVKQRLDKISESLWGVYYNYIGNETRNEKSNIEAIANLPKFNL